MGDIEHWSPPAQRRWEVVIMAVCVALLVGFGAWFAQWWVGLP